MRQLEGYFQQLQIFHISSAGKTTTVNVSCVPLTLLDHERSKYETSRLMNIGTMLKSINFIRNVAGISHIPTFTLWNCGF